jgi:hypothetical protein
MTLRADIITDAQAAWFDTDGLAQTVVYTQPSRALGVEEVVKEIPAIIQPGENLKDAGRYQVEEMSVMIPVAEITAPLQGDIITAGDFIWTVRRIKAGDALGIAWDLECTKGARAVMRERP